MNKRYGIQPIFFVLIIFASGPLLANELALQAYTREALSLNGEWKAIVDPYENGYYNYRYVPFDESEPPSRNAFFTDSKMNSVSDLIEYDFDQSLSIQVPGDWNTQHDKLYYYEGSVWYRKKFDVPSQNKNTRKFLYFGAINYRADVYLNGKKLGVHTGGFTPFHYEVTEGLMANGNSLVIKVDNKRHADAVPTLNTDWWNYGGITRDVKLLTVPNTFIRDFKIELVNATSKMINVTVDIDKADAGTEVILEIPELKAQFSSKVNKTGKANFSFPLMTAELWSPSNPKRYRFVIKSGDDKLEDDIGLRTIATRGKELLLNDKPLFLRGISIHEEYAAEGQGRVSSKQAALQLIKWAKSLESNFVRLAHYPHNEHMVRQAEAEGLLIWSEIPVYWTINWENENTYRNAEAQLSAMINRDKNRAAIIIWSLANETPVSGPRNRFLKRLANKARELDSSRLLSAAMEKHSNDDEPNVSIVKDPLAKLVDIVSFNQYLGWYYGTSDSADDINWRIPYNKPVFVSEFGGGAKAGYHGDVNTRWTEEYQENLYRKNLSMLDRIDGFIGTSPWILADFRSPRRLLVGIQNDFNRKGVMSETGVKKKAFYVLKDFYAKKKSDLHNR